MLVATDFSLGSLTALQEARWLSQRAGLPLQVLHVATSATWEVSDQSAAWLRAAGLEATAVVVRRGLAWVELVRHAREVSAAMIVVGSHGASGMQRLKIGSMANRLVTSAPCPVLVVAGGEERLDAGGEAQSLVKHITGGHR